MLQYGLNCHIEASPFGGMRTILRVPAHLLTVMEEDRSLSALAPKPVQAQAASAHPAPTEQETAPVPQPAGGEAAALPSRRRRAPRPAPARPAHADAAPDREQVPRTPEQAGASWAALQQGTLNGRSVAGRPFAPAPDDHDHPDDRDEQGDDQT